MEILTFAEELQKKIMPNTEPDIHDDLVLSGKAVSNIRDIIIELKTFTTSYQFSGAEEEIKFFKEVKPVFLSQYYYQKKVFELKLFRSFQNQVNSIANYNKCLSRMKEYIVRNQSFYQYCVSGETYLDQHYFTRGKINSLKVNVNEKFSTGFDVKLSKILANEMVKDFIAKSLSKSEARQDGKTHLTWTGSKTDLIELIYALHAVGVFNHATPDIRTIVSNIEILFNVDLGNYSRIFLGIRLRKNGRTTFVEELRKQLLLRIDRMEDEGS